MHGQGEPEAVEDCAFGRHSPTKREECMMGTFHERGP